MGRKKKDTVVMSTRVESYIEEKIKKDAELRTLAEGKNIKPSNILAEILYEKYGEKESILDKLSQF